MSGNNSFLKEWERNATHLHTELTIRKNNTRNKRSNLLSKKWHLKTCFCLVSKQPEFVWYRNKLSS